MARGMKSGFDQKRLRVPVSLQRAGYQIFQQPQANLVMAKSCQFLNDSLGEKDGGGALEDGSQVDGHPLAQFTYHIRG